MSGIVAKCANLMQAKDRPVVLLMAEAVTLAHYGRIMTLARALDTGRYRVVVATDPRYLELDPPTPLEYQAIHSIATARFADALARGSPLYDVATLSRYVEEDLALIDRLRPDLVVGDFRLSLAVSAPLGHVPYAAVVNAYWSPYADTTYPVPDLPMTRILGVGLAQRLFDLARPLAFAAHALPLNTVRRRHGLPTLGHDLRRGYTWADYTLYADSPDLITTRSLPASHRYLGPVLWSARTPLPPWWNRLPTDKPVIFLTLGSSGRADLLPAVLRELARLPVTIVAATAGRNRLASMPDNVYTADYLPMDVALNRARLLICNGGSLTTYQALGRGVPVIGLCSNMDQLLNMQALARRGAGILLRAARTKPEDLRHAAADVLADPGQAQAVRQLGESLKQYDSGSRFRDAVADILHQRS